ncbi:VCBS repeat-containing protein [Polyangium sp. 6x1]|uniref:FG-GAP repeat domain-containing protein n=1 Tax=Polyangium sp. 6x1 TaxID=3042689 RepID=UPI0024826C87|nr:VCBS repeat-containing protein [Polyangium sp. 6x1]MDI1442537.1 VCBS repeat-containing protein [Polyangium sp. 6x1]
MSGGVVFQWETDPTSSESLVQVCSDKLCANVVETLIGQTGAVLSAPLPRGAYFVRGRGRRMHPDQTFLEGTKWSTTRSIFVTGRPVTSPALLGMRPDIDADGIPERVIGNTFPPTSAGATITVLWGNGTSTILSGGWSNNGITEAAFASTMQNGGDIDGDGRPEIVTIKQLRVSQPSGAWVEANPIQVLRYGMNDQGTLVQLQSHDIPAPFHSLVPAGDINGDGYADVLAVRQLNPVPTETGVEVFILFGGKQGFENPSSFLVEIPLALRTLSTQVTVRGVGDVDGDGFADVAIGINMLPDLCQNPPDGPIPGNRGYVDILRGAQANPLEQVLVRLDGIGSVTPMGDINGDGFADLGAVIKARLYRKSIAGNCASYSQHYLPGSLNIYYGSAAAPLDSSSWTLPTYTAATCTNNWNYTSTFHIAGDLAGGGDLDGDTFGDFVLATPTLFDVSGASCLAFPGRVHVFYGAESGIVSPPAQIIDGPDGNDRRFGRSAAIMGHVTGSSDDDILIGAAYWRNATNTAATPARVRLYTGPSGGLAPAAVYTSGAPLLSNDSFGVRLLGGL